MANPHETDQPCYIFVGLGNPGLRYEMTRHNLGFLVVIALAHQLGWLLKEEPRFNAMVAKGVLDGAAVHLILPLTYMNLSGEAVRAYLAYYKLPVASVAVVTDDIAVPFGQMRLKTMGSAGGHNGLKSVEEHLGTNSYIRLRMGIGHPGVRNLVDYVLEPFNQEEMKELKSFIDRGREVLRRLVKEEISRLMNEVNTIPKEITKLPEKGEENTHESTKTKPL